MLNKIKENLQKVLKDIDKRFEESDYLDYSNDPPDREPYLFDEEIDDSNPYEGASWGPAENWHCIRCGSHLREMDEKDPSHGAACFADMRKNGVLNYQCSNKECFHYSAPLTLHHPIGGYESPPGDSYSISWIR